MKDNIQLQSIEANLPISEMLNKLLTNAYLNE